MKKILLLSDTHTYWGSEIEKHIQEVDEVWHAGDIGNIQILDNIQNIKPLRAVYGNVDDSKIRTELPLYQYFISEEVTVLMTHISGTFPRYNLEVRQLLLAKKPKLFICGHSHILKVQMNPIYQCMHFNPGAIGKQGFHTVRTMLRFNLQAGNITDLFVIEFK